MLVPGGGSDDDILIGGRTNSDGSITRLTDLRTEWTSANSYATRSVNLRAGVGASNASLKAAIYDCQNIQKLTFSEIDLPVDLTTADPLQIDSVGFKCPFVESLGAESTAVSFRLPKVKFRVLSERLL